MGPDETNPRRRLRALHPRDWQFVNEEGLDRIIKAAGASNLDSDAQLSLGSGIEAAAQSLVELWGESAPNLDSFGYRSDEVPRRVGRPVNYALRVFIDSLVAYYSVQFDRAPGVSVHHSTRESGGPLVEFLFACCKEIQSSLEDPERLEIDLRTAGEIRSGLDRQTKASLQKRVQRDTRR